MLNSSERMLRWTMRAIAVAAVLWGSTEHAVAAVSEPTEIAPVDPAPCRQAAAANDVDAVIDRCDAVIDFDKTAKPDRLAALLARAEAYRSKQQFDRALADYDAALRLDATKANPFNSRGELRRRQGDRPGAVRDFAAALKLDPQHEAARANQKSLAQELERIGAELAVKGKPSFDCARARQRVEKAICADPALADLDREVAGAFDLVLRDVTRAKLNVKQFRRSQEVFLSRRAASFGRPGYDLRAAMQARIRELLGVDGY
jgi:tetratricopeptide (TPR) repeat protein